MNTKYDFEEDTISDERRKSIECDEFSVDFNALYVKAPKVRTSSVEDEVQRYINSPRPNEKTYILYLWKEHQKM